VIVLTGGPGGGKSTLIDELRSDPTWGSRFVALPETVHYACFTNVSPRERLFQRVIVKLQIALEEGLDQALGPADPRVVLCHRGSLDPLAFWRQRGWPEQDFYEYTGTTIQDHYRRYTAVLHLVTAADGADQAYVRWPDAHRPEVADEAIRIDRWLHEAWCGHPCYFRLSNERRDWETKSREARRILMDFV
jgi:hypothetical protein